MCSEFLRFIEDALGRTLQEKELHAEDARGKIFVGNRRVLRLASFPDRPCILEQQVASLEVNNVSLGDRMSGLTASHGAYKHPRNRFISTSKRDEPGSATEADRRGQRVGSRRGCYCRCLAIYSGRRDLKGNFSRLLIIHTSDICGVIDGNCQVALNVLLAIVLTGSSCWIMCE